MAKIYETTIKLNAALGKQYSQTFAAAQKMTNGYSDELMEMQNKAAGMSGLASLGDQIQSLQSEMDKAGGGTEDQTNRLKYLTNEYETLSTQLSGSVVAFSDMAKNAEAVTDAFESQEIAAKSLAQTEQALNDVESVKAQRKEVERLKKLYESMPNKQLASDLKAQEKALSKLEHQTGLTGRSMDQLEKRQSKLLHSRTIKKFSDAASKAFGKTQGAAKAMAGGVAKAAKVFGAALAATTAAVGVFANETGQKLADTEQRARQFGMDTDVFQGFEYSMKKNGVERDQYIDGLQTLQERMVEALKEPGEMRDNFAKLGITMGDLKKKNVGEVFKQMAGNAHMLGTEAEQTKMGLDMLGGEGGKIMAAMAKEGIAGMEADFSEAQKLGAIATEDQIKNAMKYQDSVHQMAAAWDAIKQTIGNAVMPVVTKFMDTINKWLKENPEAIQKVGDAVKKVADSVSTIFTQYIVPYIGPTIDFFIEWGPLIAGVAATVAGFVGIIQAVTAATAIWNAVVAMNPVVLVVMAIIAAVGLAVYLIVKYWDDIVAAWDYCVKKLNEGIDWIVDMFLSIPDKLSSIGTSLISFFTGVMDSVKGVFKSGINWVISKINGLSFTVPDWVPEIGGSTIGANIPMLAAGGIATRPTTALIGEGGEPEAVLPLSKLDSLMGGGMGGISLTITQNISLNGSGNVEEQAKRGAASGAQDLAAQIEAIMRRNYRLAM